LVQRSDTNTGDSRSSLGSSVRKLQASQVLRDRDGDRISFCIIDCSQEDLTYLRQAHALQEDQGLGKLGLSSLLVPSELSTHDLDDSRKGVKCGLDVQEGQSSSTSDKVGRLDGVLGSAGVTSLGLDVRVEVGETNSVHRPTLAGGSGHRSDVPSSVTVSRRQVLGNFGIKTELLNQLDKHGRGPSVGTDQLDVLGETLSERLQVVLLDSVVNGLLGHGSAGNESCLSVPLVGIRAGEREVVLTKSSTFLQQWSTIHPRTR
jgi:hypothetical protein